MGLGGGGGSWCTDAHVAALGVRLHTLASLLALAAQLLAYMSLCSFSHLRICSHACLLLCSHALPLMLFLSRSKERIALGRSILPEVCSGVGKV